MSQLARSLRRRQLQGRRLGVTSMRLARGVISRCIACAIAVVTVLPLGAEGAEELSVQVSPSLSSEPGAVRLLIRFSPDDANRWLVVEVDSADLFRSSVIQLEGERAAAVHWVHLKSLPAGRYQVRVTLRRAGEPAVAATNTFRVVE